MADHKDSKTESLTLLQQQPGSSPERFAAVGEHFSMLRLDSFNSNSSSNSLKRPRSPPPPQPKKEKLSPLHPGHEPITRTRPIHPLRRCISDLSNPPTQAPPPAAASPPSVVSTRPPRPELHRTVSDLISNPDGKSGSGDEDESPDFKKVRRLRDRFREMTMWFNQVLLENEQEVQESKLPEQEDEPKPDNSAVTKDHKTFEESVYAESVGECIVIRFNCGCGAPCQFLLAGDNCYYKLM